MKLYKLTSLFLLSLLAACSDKDMAPGTDTGMDDTNLADVTLNISISALEGATRADITDVTISRGTKIDELIYAVYESEKGKDNFSIANYYGENGGQTRVDFSKAEDYRHIVTLKVDREKDYKIVCWAQSSECDAYDTSELTNIMVSYEDATNNDELRDAFAGVASFDGSQRYQEVSVDLKRPFAQINIGTSGADYANFIYYEHMVPKGMTITQSKVKVKGVANRLNLLTGEAKAVKVNSEGEDEELKSGDNPLEANFDWANLPAWINLDPNDNEGLPTRPGLQDGEEYKADNDPFVWLKDEEGNTTEEFLYIRLNDKENDKVLYPYITDYPTIQTQDDFDATLDKPVYLTETFKYLSMCYVLVPTVEVNDETTGATVELAYDMQGTMEGRPGMINLTERTIPNVPVQANYRTNILGGLYEKTDSEDPTTIFNCFELPLILVDDFDTDTNSRYYTANLEIYRNDPDYDGLQIEDTNGTDFNLNDGNLEVEYLAQTVFFSDTNYEAVFSVGDNYIITVVSNTDNYKDNKWIENTWKWQYSSGKDNEDKDIWVDIVNAADSQSGTAKKYRLLIYPGATAAHFTITVE